MEYRGYEVIRSDDERLAQFYEAKANVFNLLENQYLLVEDLHGKLADSYVWQNETFRKVGYTKIGNDFTGVVKPRNTQQEVLFDMLVDKQSTVKLVTGGFGCGKTMSLVVAALDAISKGRFEKIIWVRNNIEVKDTTPLGALPGSAFDKLLPYVGPLADHVGGMEGIEDLMQRGQLEVQHLGFIRGRDIKNSIIISTEAENLTKQHVQLLIGRVGEGSNLWLEGDYSQVDKKVFEESSGMKRAVDKLKGEKLFGYINLPQTERSETARLADKLD